MGLPQSIIKGGDKTVSGRQYVVSSFIDKLRAVWTTNSLVLLYDLAFLNKLLLDVEVRRAVTVTVSILLMGGSGVAYALILMFKGSDLLPFAAVPMLLGAALFGAATWQRKVKMGFTPERTSSLLASTHSILIDLDNEEVLPALVERSIIVAQKYIAENKIREAQECTDLAQSIWINTVLRQHTNFKEFEKAYAKQLQQMRERTRSLLARRSTLNGT